MKKYFIIALVTVVGGTMLKLYPTVNLSRFEWFKNEKEEGEEKEKESGADRQMMSWFWSRAYPDPTDLNHKFYEGWLQAQAMRHHEIYDGANGTSGTNGIDYFNGNWVGIGPSQNIGGRILSIAIDPSNGSRIFVG